MTICGIKLTHDGGIAILKEGRLVASIEMEKINNNPRYSHIQDLGTLSSLLNDEGYSVDQIDHFVIDGWHGQGLFSTGEARIRIMNGQQEVIMPAAPYHEEDLSASVLHRFQYDAPVGLGGQPFRYSSYTHVAGHLMSAYCTSPAALRNESSFILTWDGGQYPRLYYFDAEKKSIANLGPIFFFSASK